MNESKIKRTLREHGGEVYVERDYYACADFPSPAKAHDARRELQAADVYVIVTCTRLIAYYYRKESDERS